MEQIPFLQVQDLLRAQVFLQVLVGKSLVVFGTAQRFVKFQEQIVWLWVEQLIGINLTVLPAIMQEDLILYLLVGELSIIPQIIDRPRPRFWGRPSVSVIYVPDYSETTLHPYRYGKEPVILRSESHKKWKAILSTCLVAAAVFAAVGFLLANPALIGFGLALGFVALIGLAINHSANYRSFAPKQEPAKEAKPEEVAKPKEKEPVAEKAAESSDSTAAQQEKEPVDMDSLEGVSGLFGDS